MKQINLRGKKTYRPSCRCCVVENFKPEIIDKIHAYEMRNPDEFALSADDFDCVEDFLIYIDVPVDQDCYDSSHCAPFKGKEESQEEGCTDKEAS
ncbi:hypothetical protein [Xanthomonas phage BUDD]|nr:hypothetical protein [Xanthomonas phage BUDD]